MDELGVRIASVAGALERRVVLADAGARWGPDDRWRELSPPLQVVAFEPDEDECRRLEAEETTGVRYVPVALGAHRGPATLYLTRDPACASLYPPDQAAVAAHAELAGSEPVGERTVQLRTLDDWCDEERVTIDVLKLDVQGAELDVLRGAESQLRQVVMLEAEVEFNRIYQGLPLFADIDSFLRERGFVLWRLTRLAHYGRRGLDSETVTFDVHAFDSRVVRFDAQGGQLYWGHAHYVAADVFDDGADPDRVQRAALAAYGFRFADLATWLLGR
jgi:FkbM family methyltransferase